MTTPPGADRFELLEQLGRGGMGVVWKARDRETGDIVALKLLHSMYADDPDYVARFEREVEIVQRVQSRFVVPVLGYGRQGGVPYLSMEYITGGSLRDLVARRGPLPWSEAREYATHLLQGLAAARAAGVVHRDVKPSNILLGPDGTARLADFGIAKAADLTQLTGSQMTLGTPAYTAPDTVIDHRSDLYSVGCVLFELLSGAPVFEGRTQHEVVVQHLRDQPDLGRIPAEARPFTGWLLEKDPRVRPQSAEHALRALHGLEPTPAPSRSGFVTPAPASRGRGKLVGALFAMGCVAVVGSAVAAGWLLSRPHDAPPGLRFEPEVRQVAEVPPGTNGLNMWVGPWVRDEDWLIVSFQVRVSCAPDNTTGRGWSPDVGADTVVLAFEDGTQRDVVAGWGLATAKSTLTCGQSYIGAWTFDIAGASAPRTLAYARPYFVLPVPHGDDPPATLPTLNLPSALQTGNTYRVIQGRCLQSFRLPSMAAEAGPCIPSGAFIQVESGPLDNLLRFWRVSWYEEELWVEQSAAEAGLEMP